MASFRLPLAFASLAAASAAFGQATLDRFYLGATFNYSYGTGVSANGRVAVGYAEAPPATGSKHAMRWRQGLGTQDLGLLPTQIWHDSTHALGVSGDGSTVVGDAGTRSSTSIPIAFRWTEANGYEQLGTLAGGSKASAKAANYDGSVITGTGDSSAGAARSFRWTSTGMQDIGTFAGGTSASATGISADGSVIVGSADTAALNHAFRWTSAGMQDLGVLAGATESFANGVSADGSVVVGSSGTDVASQRPFRWTNGVMEELPLFPGSTATIASAVSPEGDVIVGHYRMPDIPYRKGFIWRQGSGYQDLNEYAISLGFTQFTNPFGLGPWIVSATSVSSGGKTITGEWVPINGRPFGYILSTTPVPEPATALTLGVAAAAVLRRRNSRR